MSFIEVLMAIGLPSAIIGAIVGFFVWRLQRKIDKEAKEREKHEDDRQQYEDFQVQMIMAVTALCEANAIALQNGKCNGETHAALKYLKEVKHEQRDFLISQGIEHLF
jgi:hypothetical protein